MENFHQPPNTHVSEVKLKVRDLERSLRFYREMIGFRVLESTAREAKLTADGKTTLVTLEQPDGLEPKEERTAGLYHYALLLPERSDLARIVRHFSNRGFRFGSSDHFVSEALYLSDPDGNGIEIYHDRDSSGWKWENDEVEMGVEPLNFPDLLADESGEAWDGLPEGTIMGHIHLHVSHLPDAVKFYTETLGFEVVCRYGDQAAFLSTGGYHHHIGLNTWNGVGAPAASEHRVGMRAFTLAFPDAKSREQALANLRDGSLEEDGVWSVNDPSGNRVVLTVAEQ